MAAALGDPVCLQLLLDHGADVNLCKVRILVISISHQISNLFITVDEACSKNF